MLAVDISGSLAFGTGRQSKREVAAELAAVLAFSAISNNDRVGLMQLSDHIEHYLPPRKGPRHVLRLIRDVLFFEPKRRGTALAEGLDYLNRVLRRKAIVFLFSDFLDRQFERALRRTARRHELVAIRLSDPREEELPAVGLVELEDAETGARLLVDTDSDELRAGYRAAAAERLAGLRRLMRSAGVDLIEASTDGLHLDALVRFFRMRERLAQRR
jgi:uncharacterized protein (DUF58 family)